MNYVCIRRLAVNGLDSMNEIDPMKMGDTIITSVMEKYIIIKE